MALLSKGLRILQKARVQKKLKKGEGGKRSPIKRDDQYTEQLAKDKHVRQQAKIQEAQVGAKKAKRGVQPTKAAVLEKKVLPEVSGVRAKLKGMSAKDISEKYTGKEISAMQRKIKDPRILARLQKARKMREKGHRQWETYEKGEKHTPGQKLRFKFDKSGGTLKRKSGGKMNTDGNAYVASLYKGGKVGG